MRSQFFSCPSGLRVPTVVDGVVGGGGCHPLADTLWEPGRLAGPHSSHLPTPAPVLTSRRLPLLRGMPPSHVLKGVGNRMALATHWCQWRSEEDYGAAELREPEREKWENEQAAPGLFTFFLWLLLSIRVIVLIALIFKILYLSQRLCFLWVHYLNPQNIITTNK